MYTYLKSKYGLKVFLINSNILIESNNRVGKHYNC